MWDQISEPNNEELRRKLSEIVATFTRRQVGEQIPRIAELKKTYRHSISLVREAVAGRPETFKYNCVQYAPGLVNPPREVVQVARRYEHIFPSPNFMAHLASSHLLELPEPQDGSIIVYWEDEEVRHAGKVEAPLVISKWGEFHLWRHRIYEVPITYGSIVRFFEAINAEDATRLFLEYVEKELGAR